MREGTLQALWIETPAKQNCLIYYKVDEDTATASRHGV